MSAGDGLRGFRRVAAALLVPVISLALIGCPPGPNPPANDNSDDNSNDNGTTEMRPIISTYVGNGTAGDNGDGLPAQETSLYLVQDVTVGPDGLVYFPDWNNHKIRRVDADGTVSTVAGTGMLGDAADAYAGEISFNHPTNVTFDANGDMIIAAWHNSLVKRLNLVSEPVGFVETIAGTGGRSYNGDEIPATEAILDLPSAVVVEPGTGNIIFADQANFRIRQVDLGTGLIHTLCGDGTPEYLGDGVTADQARLNSPKGQAAPPAGRITLDLQGNIIVADTGNHVIRRIDNATNIITTIAGTPGEAGYSGDGGAANAAKLNTPSDVAVGPTGQIYIADTMNHVVRVVDLDGNIRTLAGTGERGFDGDGEFADEAMLDRPYGLNVGEDGTVYIADTHNHRIRRVTQELPVDFNPNPIQGEAPEIIPCTGVAGSICTYIGTGQKGSNGDGHDRLDTVLYWPFDIAFGENGRVVFLDWNNHQVREILADDTVVTIMGSDFLGDGPLDLSDLTKPGAVGTTVNLNHPTDLLFLPESEDILVVAWHNHKLRTIDADTGLVYVELGGPATFAGDGGPAKDARVNQINRAVLTPGGDLMFTDQRNQRVRVIYDYVQDRENGIVQTIVGTGTKGYNGDHAGLATDLNFMAGGNPEPSGGLAYDSSTGILYIADSENDAIRMVTFSNEDYTESVVTTIAGTPGMGGFAGDGGAAADALLDNPQDLEIGPDGNLYIADTNNNVIRRINLADMTIETIVGTGEAGYSGDGGPAVDAQLTRPFCIDFDLDGDLYVGDTFNSRMRKVEMEY